MTEQAAFGFAQIQLITALPGQGPQRFWLNRALILRWRLTRFQLDQRIHVIHHTGIGYVRYLECRREIAAQQAMQLCFGDLFFPLGALIPA